MTGDWPSGSVSMNALFVKPGSGPPSSAGRSRRPPRRWPRPCRTLEVAGRGVEADRVRVGQVLVVVADEPVRLDGRLFAVRPPGRGEVRRPGAEEDRRAAVGGVLEVVRAVGLGQRVGALGGRPRRDLLGRRRLQVAVLVGIGVRERAVDGRRAVTDVTEIGQVDVLDRVRPGRVVRDGEVRVDVRRPVVELDEVLAIEDRAGGRVDDRVVVRGASRVIADMPRQPHAPGGAEQQEPREAAVGEARRSGARRSGRTRPPRGAPRRRSPAGGAAPPARRAPASSRRPTGRGAASRRR